MVTDLFFYAFAGLIIIGALLSISLKNIFHSALWLIAVLCGVAALFALLGADFLAVAQILTYVGGIMVILLFVIMLSNQVARLPYQWNEQWIPALFISVALGATLYVTFQGAAFGSKAGVSQPTTESIGKLLLTDFLVPFELISIVLLAALIGALYFSQKEESK